MGAALEQFARNGVEGTSVEQITAAATVAKGTFYVHFHRKEEVLLEHAAAVMDALSDPPLEAGVPEALDLLCRELAAALERMPPVIRDRMVQEVAGHREAWARTARGRPTLDDVATRVIARGQEHDEIRGDHPPDELGRALSTLLLDAAAGRTHRSPGRPLVEEFRRSVALYLHGASPLP